MDYLIEACRLMAEQHPEMRENTCVAILGGHSEEFEGKLSFPIVSLGYVSDDKRIADIYNAADVFVLPSLSENLPNTIMEAMACGVPSVGFKVGGIPEMIDHQKNGYVANYRDAKDLAAGIHWVLLEADREDLKKACLQKVMHNYSQHAVALKYIEVYNQAMAYQKLPYMIKFSVVTCTYNAAVGCCSVHWTVCHARRIATSSTSSWMAAPSDKTLSMVRSLSSTRLKLVRMRMRSWSCRSPTKDSMMR